MENSTGSSKRVRLAISHGLTTASDTSAREQEQEELARERQRLQHQRDGQHHQREQQAELGTRQHRQRRSRRPPTPRSTGAANG